MDARQPRRRGMGLAIVGLLWLSVPIQAQALPAGRLLPLAVQQEGCSCVLPTPRSDDKFILIVGSLARGAQPHRVTIQTQADGAAVSVPLQDLQAGAGWTQQVYELHDRLARARQMHPPAAEYRPVSEPPRQRTFYLFTREHDFQNPDGYVAIAAGLRAVGRYCQVYLDPAADPARLQPTIDDIVRTFDQEVYPRARQEFGRVFDVDRDGRFTILLTPWLGRLQNGKVSLGGFVRGSDFYRDLAAPYGNRCDMMYLNTDLVPGPHLHTLLAHEYTHAVIFSEHVFGGYLSEAAPQDEESWLNEGLAHLVEDLHGYSWSNLDYRISAFLAAPERYSLVVPDYYGAGLWRSHGNRGATYLFLRWCTDCAAADLPAQLIRSSLTGVANVETATRQRFADLFRGWSAALALSGTHLPVEGIAPLWRIDPYRPLGGRLLCGPRLEEVALGGTVRTDSLAGTSAAYYLLHSPAGQRSRLVVTAEPGTELQVSLIRLPEQTGRLSLRVERTGAGRGVRLILTAQDADATLDAAAWERLVPLGSGPEETSYRPEVRLSQTVQDWFGDPHLKAGESRTSPVIVLPAGGPAIFKVAGCDPAGHRLAGTAIFSEP